MNHCLRIANASSIGFKSGEYGGRYFNWIFILLYILWIIYTISNIHKNYCTSKWWIFALSMIKIDRGSEYELYKEITFSQMKSLNISVIYELCTISQTMKPSTVYAERRNQRSERLIGLYSKEVTLFGIQPYFRSMIYSFAANSSMNINWFAFHPANSSIHAFLNSWFRSAARFWIYLSNITSKIFAIKTIIQK